MFPIVQTSIEAKTRSRHEQGSMEIIRRRGMMSLSSFHSFVRFPFRVTNKMSDKESTTKRTAQGTEMVGLDGSSSRQQCWTGTTLSDTARRT